MEEVIREFLSETGPLVGRIDELPGDMAADLYTLYGEAAQAAASGISQLDPELRVTLCGRQDELLERIIDLDILPEVTGVRGVYTPAIQACRRWSNVELLKDKGLAGYLLANELHARPVMMFGTRPEEYPYTGLLPGLEMLYTDAEPGTAEVYAEYLHDNYKQMDVLILHGMYDKTVGYLKAYRTLRPEGKVFCGLDMNSEWMGNIGWNHRDVREFAGRCDVIATSCRMLRDALNRNPRVSFPCRWFPNAFYNPTGADVIADADKKKNVILTVGRIGHVQKNNEELLTAFALAGDALDGWSLRLVGPIEPGFGAYISRYFEEHPHLADRVVFTGAVTDKAELYREYAEAKLFALTSPGEGGTPNVYAEALVHGCMFVTSSIDAADDITDYGRLGKKYTLGDAEGLAGALAETAKNADTAALRAHIPKALEYARRYYDWNRNAKKLKYMLFS